MSLKPEHQNETHFRKRSISVDDFEWHVELDQRYAKSFVECNGDESLQNRWPFLDRRDRRAAHVSTEKLDPQEHREFRSGAGICQCMTEQRLDIAFITKEIMREAAGPTTASKTKLKRIARYLKGRQRCVLNFPCGKAGRRHPCDGGCRLGWKPKDKVLHVQRSGGNRSVLHCSTLVCGHRQQYRYPQPSQRPRRLRKFAIEALCVEQLLEHQTARLNQVCLATHV